MPTVVIAASDATDLSKSKADYVCTGTNDQTTLNAAIAAHGSFGFIRVALTEGTFNIAAAVSNVTQLTGCGWSTSLNFTQSFGGIAMRFAYASDLFFNGNGNELQTIQLDGFMDNCYFYDFVTAAPTNPLLNAVGAQVSNCYFEDIAGLAYRGLECSLVATYFTGCAVAVDNRSVNVSACHFTGCETGVLNTATGSHATVSASIFRDTGKCVDATQNMNVSGNVFRQMPAGAVTIKSSISGGAVVIADNLFVCSEDDTIAVLCANGGASPDGPTITGNRIIMDDSGGTPDRPIVVESNVQDTLVSNNDFRNGPANPIDDSGTGTSTGAGNFINGTWV